MQQNRISISLRGRSKTRTTLSQYMEDNGPLNELLEMLEASLTSMLQRVRTDPWSLLIFQTLLWSFRRWAIHQLMSSEINTTLHDYLWDNHIDLVRNFAPDGLKEFAIVWLNPSNVGDRIDLLEELNAYFLFIVDKLDEAIQDNNDDSQDSLSTFLDETITNILEKWLAGREEYKIYPGASDSADSFSSDKIFTIMQTILEKHVRKPVVTPEVAPEPVAEPVHVEEPVPEPVTEPLPVPVPVPVTVSEPVPEPVLQTVASALKKRTLRIKRQNGIKSTKKLQR